MAGVYHEAGIIQELQGAITRHSEGGHWHCRRPFVTLTYAQVAFVDRCTVNCMRSPRQGDTRTHTYSPSTAVWRYLPLTTASGLGR